MPRHEALDLASLRAALQDIFVLERDKAGGMAFRLAGTRVRAILGEEPRGRSFVGAFANPFVVGACLSRVAAGSVQVEEASGISRDGRASFRFEIALMPLTARGIPGAAAVGVLAPLGPPAWCGQALAGLELVPGRMQDPVAPQLGRPILAIVGNPAA